MFEALTLDVDRPQRLQLRHPVFDVPLTDDAGEPAWVDLYGLDSDRAQAVVREQLDLVRERNRMLNEAELRAGEARQLAACVAAWSLCGLDGKRLDVPCTRENAEALLGLPGAAWLRQQIAGFVRDRGNFLRRPSIN